MAKPSSRQELIDYCLRQLGEPVLEVNVDDDQIEDAVDDAIQFFHERHFDGVEKMYLKHQITEDMIDAARSETVASTGISSSLFFRGAVVLESYFDKFFREIAVVPGE